MNTGNAIKIFDGLKVTWVVPVKNIPVTIFLHKLKFLKINKISKSYFYFKQLLLISQNLLNYHKLMEKFGTIC